MSSSSYSSLISRLYAIPAGRKLSLDAAAQLHRIIGTPSQHFPTVHVVGSNGKGSVCWKLAAALRASRPRRGGGGSSTGALPPPPSPPRLDPGIIKSKSKSHRGGPVGLFVSPHVSSFRERIQVDGELIPEAAVLELLPPLLDARDRLDRESGGELAASFFEVTTLLAWQYFAQQQVGIAVMEAGCGGRRDATALAARPRLAVLTSVSLEHTRVLGPDVASIAREKAAIVQGPGVPLVAGPGVPLAPVREVIDALGPGAGPLVVVPNGEEGGEDEEEKVDQGLGGGVGGGGTLQQLSDRIALTALEVLDSVGAGGEIRPVTGRPAERHVVLVCGSIYIMHEAMGVLAARGAKVEDPRCPRVRVLSTNKTKGWYGGATETEGEEGGDDEEDDQEDEEGGEERALVAMRGTVFQPDPPEVVQAWFERTAS
eukprot:g498.t1